MSAIVTAAQRALSAWIVFRAGGSIDQVRTARIELDAAEVELGKAFDAEKVRHSQMQIGDWTVTVEANAEMTDLGLVPAFPIIMYHQQHRRAA